MAHHPVHPSGAPEHGEGEHHGIGHIVPPRILITTAVGLLILTFITVKVAAIDFAALDLKELNIFIALGIAVLKASLVCLFFMHLRWDRPFNAFVLVTSLTLVGLFISFAMTDSSEYQHEIIKGEPPLVQTKLSALPKAVADAEAEAESTGHTAPAEPAHH